tara:strand:- start:1148 stop:1387 length:240 start_codon:yes stop_codon:yes gene_type:complete
MQAIIFITLSVLILGFVLFLGVRAIQKGLNSKSNKDFIEENSGELNNSISDELRKLNELLKSGAITDEDYKKAKEKILS